MFGIGKHEIQERVVNKLSDDLARDGYSVIHGVGTLYIENDKLMVRDDDPAFLGLVARKERKLHTR